MASKPTYTLPELAAKLAAEGPSKHEPTNRRVRVRIGSEWVIDTNKAEFVWEHPYYPYYYLPRDGLASGPGRLAETSAHDGFWLGTLTAGGKTVDVAGFTGAGPLQGLVKVPWAAADAWFAEDDQQLGPHPKDPYKRVECLASSREVRIEVDGVVVARSAQNVFLHESLLRPRYYLSASSVLDWHLLQPSDTETYCPYKGRASYYHLKVGDREIRDAVWYYPYPTAESMAVQGRLCFYNEKVDVFVDGVKE